MQNQKQFKKVPEPKQMWANAKHFVQLIGGRCQMVTFFEDDEPGLTLIYAFVPDPGEEAAEATVNLLVGLSPSACRLAEVYEPVGLNPDSSALVEALENGTAASPVAMMSIHYDAAKIQTTVLQEQHADPFEKWAEYTLKGPERSELN